jgi:hypothetical protein
MWEYLDVESQGPEHFFEQFMRHPVAYAMVEFRSEDGSLLLAEAWHPLLAQ